MPIHVLAIDDSRIIRELVLQALVPAGLTVTLAEDGAAGVERFEMANPDVVITDVNMPRMNGFDVVKTIRGGAINPRVPILVLTTEVGTELKQRARAAGATGWIVKPFEDAVLLATVLRVAGRSYD